MLKYVLIKLKSINLQEPSLARQIKSLGIKIDVKKETQVRMARDFIGLDKVSKLLLEIIVIIASLVIDLPFILSFFIALVIIEITFLSPFSTFLFHFRSKII